MPSLELTTIGRKTGRPRSIMLTSPLQEGDTYVVVASRDGDDIHPAWLLNLRDNPAVEVRVVGRSKQPMQARIATPEERARMWPIIAGRYRNYAGYRSAPTGRSRWCCSSPDPLRGRTGRGRIERPPGAARAPVGAV